jgi:hypothetical protein
MRKRMMIRSLSAAVVLSVILGAAFWACAELDDNRFPLSEPGQSSRIGVVNRVEKDEIVINDRLYRLLPTTACYTSAMGAGSIHLFHPGDRVGFIANPRMEVLHLWLLPKQ